jgi:chaperone required for assembly of F1-ATPase
MIVARRFWKTVTVEGDGIRLDDRPVRTPARAPLVLPSPELAKAVADEWRAVGDTIDPRAMPLTGLSNAAIDRIAPDPARFAADVAAYAATDLLCYRAAGPEPLVRRQAGLWDPPVDWARRRYDIAFVVTDGIVPVTQPAATIERLAGAVFAQDAFHLAALSPLATLSGSLVLALMHLEGAIDEETAWRTAELDTIWQTENWGEDPLAAAEREGKRAAFAAAVRFLSLL